jgi:trk/ktr system potassium uptake protein
MSERSSFLMYTIRGPVVLKYTAQLILVQAGLLLLPVAIALFYAEYEFSLRLFAVVCLLVIMALPFIRLPVPGQIQANEALAITVIAFVLGAAAMVYPFMEVKISFLDAVFESVSGITTTGLSTVAELEDKPRSFLFARAWMQWYGGLGFGVLALALLIGQQPGNRRLLGQELDRDGVVIGIRKHARQVTLVYLLLTLISTLLLYFLGADGFTAIVHSLSAVSTGGFSCFNNNLAGFDGWPIQMALSGIGLLGAVSLPLYYRIYRHGFSLSTPVQETLVMIVLIFSVTLILTLIMHANSINMDWLSSAKQALLLAISAQTTTGFSSLNSADFDPLVKNILILSMAVGGDMGSTAGGIKILRFMILLKLMQFTIQRTAMPSHAVFEPNLAGKAITTEEITDVLALLGWFIALVFFSWLPFIALNYHPLDALFEVVSATATVGLSSGIAQAELQPVLKLILCFDMLAGRLEIIALLVCLYPKTWFGRRIEEL